MEHGDTDATGTNDEQQNQAPLSQASGRSRYEHVNDESFLRFAEQYSQTRVGEVTASPTAHTINKDTNVNNSSFKKKLALGSKHKRFNNKNMPRKATRQGNDAAAIASIDEPPVLFTSALQTIPLAHELAFYVALESCPHVREHWESVIESFNAFSKTDQPKDDRCQHAQLIYNSTQSHMDRLAKVVESVRERRQRDKTSCDSQSFIPIYNFYKHEKSRFYEVLLVEAETRRCSAYNNIVVQSSPAFRDYKLFGRFVKKEAMTELVLDGSFKGRTCHLPKCIFTASNLQRLSLCENNLRCLPADIGRLERLRVLQLSRNRLKNDSIPYTLCYCKLITTLHIDYNMLDAVPGFVLELKNLKTLHRHGNQNYFRSTFMWYGCESRERIRTASFSDVDVAAVALECATQVQSLKFWSAKSIISSKTNYFELRDISEPMKDYISEVYSMFNICAACRTASLLHSQGYFVFTFQNPFVGNTCVPFQHWTCSKDCALSIEIPARRQQIRMARQQQKTYDTHVRLYSRQPDTIHEHALPDCSGNTNGDGQYSQRCHSSTHMANVTCPRCQPSREYRDKRLRCLIM